MTQRKLFVFHLISLLLGGLIYIFFRSSSLLMFRWFEYIGIFQYIESTRNSLLIYSNHLPNWIIYALPDGLWVFSYTCFMLSIWTDFTTAKSVIWTLFIPVFAILTEIGQGLNLIQGTFDSIDVLCYIVGVAFPYILLTINKN